MAHLPITRVKIIMRTADGSEVISKDATYVTAKAAELFIKDLASTAYKIGKDKKKLTYDAVAQAVHDNDRFDFLEQIIPKKITVKEFKQLMAKKRKEQLSSGEDDSSEDSTSSED